MASNSDKAFADLVADKLAPVKHLWDDPTVTEILINGIDQIFVERKGKLELTPAVFPTTENLVGAANAIADHVGRYQALEKECRVDARLPDGSRVHIVINPVARTNGPVVSIRKFTQTKTDFRKYVEMGSLSAEGANFLRAVMYIGKNVLVSGGTGSGKTTLLSLLCTAIPPGQRVLVIEDSSELAIEYEHVVRFETRMPNHERGITEISMKDLLKSALRLRPDRIIVGEVRGSEGFELVQAMNTGHKGCMGTIHANTPAEALVRLEALSMGGDNEISEKALQLSIGSAVNVIVQISRLSDGSRKITHISEIRGLDKSMNYICVPIFQLSTPIEVDGKLECKLVPTGEVPTFYAELEGRLPGRIPRAMFFPPKKAS